MNTFSIIPHNSSWVIIFNSLADKDILYSDFAYHHKYSSELWFDLGTGACRLGEPATSDFLTVFSPDGQYCSMVRKIMPAPAWPQGAGVVGKTYSRMPQVGTLPDLWWNGIEGPCWSPDSRCIMYFSTADDDTPFGNARVDRAFRWLEHHTPLRFPQPHGDILYHLVDTTGREVSSGLGYWPEFVGPYLLTNVYDAHLYTPRNREPQDEHQETARYYLITRTGNEKREIFRVLPNL